MLVGLFTVLMQNLVPEIIDSELRPYVLQTYFRISILPILTQNKILKKKNLKKILTIMPCKFLVQTLQYSKKK
jgi:hypothetical protein